MVELSSEGWSVEDPDIEFTQTYDTTGYQEAYAKKDKTPDSDAVSGGGFTVPTSEEGIAELTEQYKSPETKYKYTMDSLETDAEWNKNADIIYKHENEGKEYSVDEEGFKSAADWLKNRHSELGADLTSLAATAYDSQNMSEETKDAWFKTMEMYENTKGDLGAFLRSLKNFGQDPITIASLIGTFGIATVAKAIGGKAVSAAARFEFKEQLKKQLAKTQLKNEVIERAIKHGGTKEVSKQIMTEARKKAASSVAKAQMTSGGISGGAYMGADKYLRQELKGGLGMYDEEGRLIKDMPALERAGDVALSVLGGSILGSLVGGAVPKGIEALTRAKGIRNANDTLTAPEVPVVSTPNYVATKIDEGVDITDAQPKQRWAITEKLIRLNTGAGRLLASRAALPKALFNAAVQKSRGEKAITFEIRNVLRTFSKDFKTEKSFRGMSQDKKDEIVNKYLDTGEVDPLLAGTKTLTSLNKARVAIEDNEGQLNKLLGIEGTDAALGLNRKDGQLYISRTLLANNDPRYLARIQEILKDGKVSRMAGLGKDKKLTAEFLAKVEGARKDLRKVVDSDVTDDQIDNIIEEMVKRLAKPKSELEGLISLETILPSSPNLAGARASILKKRKDLSEPILELLGRENDPYKKVVTTLQKQKRLIAELEFLGQVDDFARTALKKDGDEAFIKLGNFISFLPKQQVKIYQKGSGDAVGTGDVSLFDLTEAVLGKQLAGIEGTTLLKDIYTSPQMSNYLKQGIDIWSSENSGGRGLGTVFGNVAAIGQATQTILDQGAYLVNSYGAFQALVANGYLTGSLLGRHGATVDNSVKQILNQYSAKDPRIVAEISRMKRDGVIDTDLSAELITKGMNAFGRDPKNWVTRGYRKSMGTLSEAYGTVDTVAKIYAHNVERQNLKKIFKKELKDGSMTEDDIFKMSSDRVRNVMPSYSVASPAARLLGRLPFGTYALFPSEVVRNKKNVIKLSLQDMNDGRKRIISDPAGGARQIVYGVNRLAGAAMTTAGVGAYVSSNNEVQGVDESHNRFLDMVSESWGVGANRFFTQGFQEQQDGRILTRYSNSAQFDAEDFYKVPVRLLFGRALAGENVKPFEIDDLLKGARNSIVGPYTNPKFITQAIINVMSNQDRSGRPIYSEAEPGLSWTNIRRGLEEFKKALSPGTAQIYSAYNDSLKAMGYEGGIEGYIEYLNDDEIREMGKSASGFPLNIKDIENWLSTGIRTTTADVGRSLGFKLSKDIKTMDATGKDFITYLRRIKPQNITPELTSDIVNEYKRLQEIKFKGFTALSDKISTAMNMTYTNKNGKVVPYGYDKVLAAATDSFNYDVKDDIVFAGARSATKNAREGIFIPDDVTGDTVVKILTDKFSKSGASMDIYNQLIAASTEYKQVPIVTNKEDK